MGLREAPLYLLCKDANGWLSTESRYLANHQAEEVQVARGALLKVENCCNFDPLKSVTVTVSVLDSQGVKMTALLKDLVSLTNDDFQRLCVVSSLETRFKLATLHRSLSPLTRTVGDLVTYSPPGHRPVRAVVKYIGPVPALLRLGYLVGLEVEEEGWQGGNTDGYVEGVRYFHAERDRGVFCDIGSVGVISGGSCFIESAEKLESLNQGYVGRMTALMDNMENNNTKFMDKGQNKLNLTLSDRKGRSNLVGKGEGQSGNSLRRIHNDLKQQKQEPGSEAAPSHHNDHRGKGRGRGSPPNDRVRVGLGRPQPEKGARIVDDIVTSRAVRSNRSRELDSDRFSWDPNSRNRSSRASSKNRRDPSRDNSRSGSVTHSPKTSPEFGVKTSRPSPGVATHNRLSPGDGGVYQGGGYHHQQDWRADSRVAPSVARSSSIEFGNNGGHDSGRDTPPSLPPRERDTFVTPHEETEKTWGQTLSDNQGTREDTPDNLQFRPASSQSVSPPLDFVEPWRGDCQSEVVVGSMVQLETQQGEQMFGVVKYIGDAPGPGRWAGVEMEDEVRGGNTGWVQNRQLFSCPEGKGVFVPYTHVVPDPRFKETLPTPPGGQDFGPKDSPIVPGYHPPCPTVDNVMGVSGRNKGIQGHQNSCYLDATLFSMFCFTSVFDSLLYRPRGEKDIARYDEVQRVLREEIVNPLRKSLFVRADRVMNLRTMLDSLSDVQGLTDQEKDPEEFLSSLLTQVMKAEPFLELSSGQTAHHYQLFVEKDPDLLVPTVQDLFDQSFNTSRVKLKRAPPVLILQMPRFGRQFKVYDRILPSQLLDVTDIISSSPRQCVICGVLAEWECPSCYGDHDTGLASTAFCPSCLQRTHQHKRRLSHKQERLAKPPGWSKQQAIPRIYMELVAVVCIETSHYVSFVRCGDSPRAPWCFFDSMADRKGEQNGYNIPELSPAPDVEKILSEVGAGDVKNNPNVVLGDQAKRLVSDAYMCFYQSPDVRMYR